MAPTRLQHNESWPSPNRAGRKPIVGSTPLRIRRLATLISATLWIGGRTTALGAPLAPSGDPLYRALRGEAAPPPIVTPNTPQEPASDSKVVDPAAEPPNEGRVQKLTMPEHLVTADKPLASRVVLLRMGAHFPDETWTAVEERTRAELRALGLEVVSVQGRARRTDTRLAELGAQAAVHRALAALRIVRSGKGRSVQVWLYDAVTGKMVLRRTQVVPEGGMDGSAVAALRVVELLHASLLEVRMPGRFPKPRRRPVPRIVRQLVARRMSQPSGSNELSAWSIGLLPSVAYNPGGLAPVWALTFGLSYHVKSSLRLTLDTTLPLAAAQVGDPRGEAAVSLFVGRARVDWTPVSWGPWSPWLGASLGALALRAAGDAAVATVGERVDWTAGVLGMGHAGTTVRLGNSWTLVADLALGATLPALEVRFDEDAVKTVGRPLLLACLGLSYAWR